MDMTYGAVELHNGKIKGKLHFSTGKVMKMNVQENIEFHNKIRYWQDEAVEKYKNKYQESEKMGWGMK